MTPVDDAPRLKQDAIDADVRSMLNQGNMLGVPYGAATGKPGATNNGATVKDLAGKFYYR